MILVDNRCSFERVSRSWDECWGMGIELWHVLEGVSDDVSNDSKTIWQLSNNWLNLLCDGLVLLLRLDISRVIVDNNVGRGR